MCHILLAVVLATSAVVKARTAGFGAFLSARSDMGLGGPRTRGPLARRCATIATSGVWDSDSWWPSEGLAMDA